MLSMLLVLILLLIATESTYLYPPFGDINHYSRFENQLDSSNSQNNKIEEVLDCNMETLLNIIGLEELQFLIESVAMKSGMNPISLLRKIIKRINNKDDFDKIVSNGIDDQELHILNPPAHIDAAPATKYAETSRVPYALPDDVVMDDQNEETDVLIIPVDPSPLSMIPVLMKPENKTRKDASLNRVNSLVGKINNVLPVFLSPLKNNHLKPPPGATVRVNSGDPLSPIGDDIIVTVSPLMTFIEALREAEIKYQGLLGISPEVDVFTFAHSAAVDCYILNSIDNIVQNKDFGWKVTILDKDGEMVYDNFCLPSGNEVSVKPGTVISLTYVPMEINL